MNRKNQAGFALLQVLIVAAVIMFFFGVATEVFRNQLAVNKTQSMYGNRTSISQVLDGAIKDPNVLYYSLYDQGCISTNLTTLSTGSATLSGPNLFAGGSCLILNESTTSTPYHPADALPNGMPTNDPDIGLVSVSPSQGGLSGYRAIELFSPASADLSNAGVAALSTNAGAASLSRIAGSYSNPVYYNNLGESCKPNQIGCNLQAIAYVQVGSDTRSAPFGNPNNYVVNVIYRLRPIPNLGGTASGSNLRASFQVYSNSATVALGTINRLATSNASDLANLLQCRDRSGNSVPGWFAYSVVGDSSVTAANPDLTIPVVAVTNGIASMTTNNGSGSHELCQSALGAQPCIFSKTGTNTFSSQWQIGIGADGAPLCGQWGTPGASRSPFCQVGQIPTALIFGPQGYYWQCMQADCSQIPAPTSGVSSTGVLAFDSADPNAIPVSPPQFRYGFLSPKTSDQTSYTCMVMQPYVKAGKNCTNYAKTGTVPTDVDAAYAVDLDCDSSHTLTNYAVVATTPAPISATTGSAVLPSGFGSANNVITVTPPSMCTSGAFSAGGTCCGKGQCFYGGACVTPNWVNSGQASSSPAPNQVNYPSCGTGSCPGNVQSICSPSYQNYTVGYTQTDKYNWNNEIDGCGSTRVSSIYQSLMSTSYQGNSCTCNPNWVNNGGTVAAGSTPTSSPCVKSAGPPAVNGTISCTTPHYVQPQVDGCGNSQNVAAPDGATTCGACM